LTRFTASIFNPAILPTLPDPLPHPYFPFPQTFLSLLGFIRIFFIAHFFCSVALAERSLSGYLLGPIVPLSPPLFTPHPLSKVLNLFFVVDNFIFSGRP